MLRFCFVLLLFVPVLARAQKTIDLPNEKFEVPFYGFKIDTVIDARVEKAQLGWVRVGLFSKEVPAVFPEELSAYLTNYVRKQYKASGEPLIMVVNQLQIREMHFGRIQRAILEVEFLLCRRQNGELVRLRKYTNRVEKTMGSDVTFMHSLHISAMIANFLQDFGDKYWESRKLPAAGN